MLDEIFKTPAEKHSLTDSSVQKKYLDSNEKTKELLKKVTLYSSSTKYTVPPMNDDFLAKKRRREENSKTAGKDWFDMKAPELTPELEQDLKAVYLRGFMDPKKFYKKSDRKTLPKFFQVGTVETNLMNGKKDRLKKGETKARLAEEMLEEDIEGSYSKKKFEKIMDKRRQIGIMKKRFNKNKLKAKGKGYITK